MKKELLEAKIKQCMRNILEGGFENNILNKTELKALCDELRIEELKEAIGWKLHDKEQREKLLTKVNDGLVRFIASQSYCNDVLEVVENYLESYDTINGWELFVEDLKKASQDYE